MSITTELWVIGIGQFLKMLILKLRMSERTGTYIRGNLTYLLPIKEPR
jgi:hypothetical protein